METNDTKQKESFIFYRSFANSIDRLPAEMQLPLYKAITSYALNLNEPTFDDCPDKYILLALWDSIKPQLDASYKRYLNGCKGGAPTGSHNNPNGRRGKQNGTNRELTKNLPNVNDNDNDNVNVGVIGDESPQQRISTNKFIKPSVQEVQEYCRSKGYNVDADRFVDYYESIGWKIGKNPMKDWKAAVRTWERKNTNDNNNNAQRKGLGKKLAMEDLI